jgi:hypothetical protein
MEKSFIADRLFTSRRPVIRKALRFSATGAGDVQSCTSGDTGEALRLAGLASGQHLLAGAACLLAWGLLWVVTLSDFVSPPGNGFSPGGYENPDATFLFHGEDPEVSHDSLPLRPAGVCGSGMVELDGTCTFGEEIEVSSPPGWRRRRAHVETD